jgi:hypothetical protein
VSSKILVTPGSDYNIQQVLLRRGPLTSFPRYSLYVVEPYRKPRPAAQFTRTPGGTTELNRIEGKETALGCGPEAECSMQIVGV